MIGLVQARSVEETMYIQRLAWAGIRISTGDFNIVIDPLVNTAEAARFMGTPRTDAVPVKEASVQLALVTHLHPDHYDPATLRACLTPRGRVLCPEEIAPRLNTDHVPHKGLEVYKQVSVGEVTVTAVPAVDGLGDDQVSWVIEVQGKRFIHCGDTLWHGNWWRLAKRFGPFDVAFLPINGAVVQFPGYTPSGMPSVLTPEQAVAAGHLLQAQAILPINYGMFHRPPIYAEQPRAEEIFKELAKSKQIIPLIIPPGTAFTWERGTADFPA
jgi:L-ascorbate metabolism protein UlaG (beta-lactamase superfamily)